MAILKIHSDIVNEEDRVLNLWWSGIDGTSFDSVDSFIDGIDTNDDTIELRINCKGGECMEGWAIYDKLRSTGKNITAIIEGKCASMASVLLLAAPKENRFAYQNASLLIHNPYIPPFTLADAYDASALKNIANDLESETNKIVNLYVERTGSDEETLRSLMSEDKFINMEKAKDLGFISQIKPPISAKEHKKWNNSKEKKMENKEKKVEVKQTLLAKMMAKLGYMQIEEAEAALNIVAMDLSTSDGSTITVERESGSPQVGDKASPDGEHLMPDGDTIVVVDGVITEIRKKETKKETETNAKLNEANAKIAELQEELSSYKAQAKSQEELTILNFVKTAGGFDNLQKAVSKYVPEGRSFVDKSKLTEQESVASKLHSKFENELKERKSKRK